jgi:hypothetical protein
MLHAFLCGKFYLSPVTDPCFAPRTNLDGIVSRMLVLPLAGFATCLDLS